MSIQLPIVKIRQPACITQVAFVNTIVPIKYFVSISFVVKGELSYQAPTIRSLLDLLRSILNRETISSTHKQIHSSPSLQVKVAFLDFFLKLTTLNQTPGPDNKCYLHNLTKSLPSQFPGDPASRQTFQGAGLMNCYHLYLE